VTVTLSESSYPTVVWLGLHTVIHKEQACLCKYISIEMGWDRIRTVTRFWSCCTHGQLWVKEPKTAVAFQSVEVVCGWFRKVSKWVSMPNRRKLCHDRLWIHILGGKAVPSPSCCIYVRSVSLGSLRHPSFDRWVRRTRRKLEYRYTFFVPNGKSLFLL